MSTEIIETNLNLLRNDLIEFINDEPLDILDEFTAEEIADLVVSIARRLLFRDFCNGHFIKYGRPNRDYLYSVNNKEKGFLSLSDECSTAVSRTEYKVFFKEDEIEDENFGWLVGLTNIAQMLNEAWYHLNND